MRRFGRMFREGFWCRNDLGSFSGKGFGHRFGLPGFGVGIWGAQGASAWMISLWVMCSICGFLLGLW